MRDIEAHEINRPWTDDEILALTPGSGKALWNRFAHLAGHPGADELMQRFSWLHDGQHCKGYDNPETGDPLDFLYQEASLRGLGVRLVRDPKTKQVTTLFPNVPARPTRKREDDWEVKAKEMHRNQTTLEIPDVPEADSYSDPIGPSLRRGD